MIEQAICDVEKIMEETAQFEQQQLQIKDELIEFLNSKVDDNRNCFGKAKKLLIFLTEFIKMIDKYSKY